MVRTAFVPSTSMDGKPTMPRYGPLRCSSPSHRRLVKSYKKKARFLTRNKALAAPSGIAVAPLPIGSCKQPGVRKYLAGIRWKNDEQQSAMSVSQQAARTLRRAHNWEKSNVE